MPQPPNSVRPELVIVNDAAALARAAAQEFCRCAADALAARGRFSVALSGGNTPRAVNSLLANEPKDLPWSKIFIFFGDERHVPPDHPDSNYRMANETLLSRVPVPESNVFRVRAELDANAAADDYDRRLREFFGIQIGAWPRFDLILLGMGDDGHTASLFPGSAALQEQSRLAVANWVEKFQSYRITLTFPVLNHGAEDLFLVSGDSKSQVLREILGPAPKQAAYPAQMVRPQDGRLLWIADKAAAHLL
ncbi:MAG TPA: 6-phosphogluconolactonase [Candidatus Angelobacter sp.]|nr:6-phosphogluconolactonase [Candidatus Angelobacter sp.]